MLQMLVTYLVVIPICLCIGHRQDLLQQEGNYKNLDSCWHFMIIDLGDHEVIDLVIGAVRELVSIASENVSGTPSMSEEEINAIPVYEHKVTGQQNNGSSRHQASSLGSVQASEDELACSICLEQVKMGELVCSLPCLHQFHTNCINPWLRQQGTCPMCKFRVGSWESDADVADIV